MELHLTQLVQCTPDFLKLACNQDILRQVSLKLDTLEQQWRAPLQLEAFPHKPAWRNLATPNLVCHLRLALIRLNRDLDLELVLTGLHLQRDTEPRHMAPSLV